MMTDSLEKAFDPVTLAGDLSVMRKNYADFFTGLGVVDWDKQSKRGTGEWSLHETIAHLCALNGSGLESVKYLLQGESYTFKGLEDRYAFNTYNRRGIDEHLSLPKEALFARFLYIHNEAANIARDLQPDQVELAARMPIYNRPVRIVEALGIIFIHAGIFHSAQVAEPAGQPPLWMSLSPEIRRRGIGRVMCALSLLYRHDLGGDLRASFMFQVDGPGGGYWHVKVSPESASAYEGMVDQPSLVIRLGNTDAFCRMFTGRLRLPFALLTGQLRLRGNLRLFPRLGSLFSVDARKR